MSDEITITIPLKEFVKSHLNNGAWSNRPINRDIASIILAKTDNKQYCYIQWPDEMSPDLQEPLLWDFVAWRDSEEKWLRQKRYSEQQRIEGEVERQNVYIVAKAYEECYGVSSDSAIIQAYKWVRNKNIKALKLIGIDKLITKETMK